MEKEYFVYKATLEINGKKYNTYFVGWDFVVLYYQRLWGNYGDEPIIKVFCTKEIDEFVNRFRNNGCPENILFDKF